MKANVLSSSAMAETSTVRGEGLKGNVNGLKAALKDVH